ncbi:hypothetical protein BGM21_10435 [Geobacillus thermoleovorans]|nr:hypothetical protein BGM21_10435 [Geobacillus thermoleovorans]
MARKEQNRRKRGWFVHFYVIDYKQSMHRQAVGDAKSKVNRCHVQEVIGAVEATTIRDAMRCLTNPKLKGEE